MDKWIETPWFVKVISLSLAALLFISVNFSPDSESLGLKTTSKKGTETVESVPVEVYYDQENLVVSGVPKKVNVTLQGPKNIVIPAKQSRDFKVYADLSDPEIELGKQRVELKIRGDLSDKIVYTIDPAFADVNIQEKITKEFKVSPEFDRKLLEDGYFAEEPSVKPEKVKITGGKDEIEKIAYVKAVINIDEGVNDTFQMNAPVQVLDSNLNKLDVQIAPKTVKVEVPIKSPGKTVNIQPVESGKPKDGYEIVSMSAEPDNITLYGKKSILDTINELQVPVDVSSLEKNAVFTVAVDLPEGVRTSSVKEVTVRVKVVKTDTAVEEPPKEPEEEPEPSEEEQTEVSKTFSDIRIRQVGLQEGYELNFISPSQGVTDILVYGKQNVLKNIKASDVQVSMNVSGLEEGEHTASLQIKTPENVRGQSTVSSAKISIKKINTEASSDEDQNQSQNKGNNVSQFHMPEFNLINYTRYLGIV